MINILHRTILTVWALAATKFVPICADQCPEQNVKNIRQQAAQHEIALVFYFVSWSEDSLVAKRYFDEVAHYYSSHLHFAAVDCWHLACNCSQTHVTSVGSGAPHKWPTLIVNYGKISLQYNGEWSFGDLTRFLERLFAPLERIYTRNDLKTLSMRSDAVILGLFANADSNEYQKYAAAAVKWLENDPEGSIRFAVVLGTAAAANVLNRSVEHEQAILSKILLYSGNRVEIFNANEVKWNASQLVQWVLGKRIFGQGLHSTPAALSLQVKRGATLAIFVNDIQFYVSMEDKMHKIEHSGHQRDTMHNQFKTCEKFWQRAEQAVWEELNTDNVVALKFQQEIDIGRNLNRSKQKEYLSLDNLRHYYTVNEYLRNLFDTFKPDNDDEKYATNVAAELVQMHEYNRCLRHPDHLTPELRISIARFLKKSTDKLSAVTASNHTLSVVILNSAKYADYLIALDIPNSVHSTIATAFIVAPQKESIYVMPPASKFYYETLMNFVSKYYRNQLLVPHQKISASLNLSQQIPTDTNEVHLQEMNRQMLLTLLEDSQRKFTAVVLLYSPACAFSAIMSHTLLEVASMLNSSSYNDIHFIRLNTQTNELPWELLMPTTPTLIVFPVGHHRSANSRIFPAHLNVNVQNVFGFILAQLEPLKQVHVVLGSCKHLSQQQQRLERCLQFAKALVMRHIGEHLHHWQLFEHERPIVLERLKQFKDLSLDIQQGFKS